MDDGGPVFPGVGPITGFAETEDGDVPLRGSPEHGISLRDYLAAKLLTGALDTRPQVQARLVKAAYQMADLALVERRGEG